MRVVLVDPDLDEASGTETFASDDTTMVPEVSAFAAPPLAVRPVEDAEWTFRN